MFGSLVAGAGRYGRNRQLLLLPARRLEYARLLPDGPDKKGADGNLLAPAIMRQPALWLCADQSNEVSGRRLIARNWDASLAPDEAAAKAMDAKSAKPHIM